MAALVVATPEDVLPNAHDGVGDNRGACSCACVILCEGVREWSLGDGVVEENSFMIS